MDSFEEVGNLTLDNYKSLKDYVNVSVVQDHFCVVHELLPREAHRFRRMWGYTVIASKRWSKRPIHHSAAHFDSEGRVCAQAAALFERTRSRSLVVVGASRYAVKGDHRSGCQRQFQIADAAHNSRTMFHWVNTVLKDLAEEDVQAEGKEDDPFFVQWHGMSETSCVASHVFISTGIANSSVYDKNIPANRLMKSFNRLATDLRMEAKTPRQDVQCKLTAGTNVFGRYVNGVPGESVCNTTAQEKVSSVTLLITIVHGTGT
ncbi:hypothetical protein ANCCAN_27205 [Ancylostoma caninum]|uniref:Uncharacterized protein n=1 Tax=Ancylostoma caninum TaxID=29170 RepID=A0A368F4T4_ANCCA|nr:hypothetical protein ANCCAN_27205 [Ancylostoma caninum]